MTEQGAPEMTTQELRDYADAAWTEASSLRTQLASLRKEFEYAESALKNRNAELEQARAELASQRFLRGKEAQNVVR